MLRARPAIGGPEHQELGLEVANTTCLWPGLVPVTGVAGSSVGLQGDLPHGWGIRCEKVGGPSTDCFRGREEPHSVGVPSEGEYFRLV